MTNQETGPSQARKLLSDAPLARVLVQVRWPELTDFRLEDVANGMARQLGSEYPLKRRDIELQVVFTPAGPQQQSNGFVHRFASAAEDWTVSIGSSFLAIEANDYQGHEELIGRLSKALTALAESSSIPIIDRVGYRYTNRIVGSDDLALLNERFSPTVLGAIGAAPEGYELVHSITESVYKVDSFFLLVRSAQVGASETIDPTLPPVAEKSWILDLDAYDESRVDFNVSTMVEMATRLSGVASNHFHSLTTPKFVERYA